MKNFLGNIFSKEEVNTSRQFEFDIAKTVCIVFMVLIHAFAWNSMMDMAHYLRYGKWPDVDFGKN